MKRVVLVVIIGLVACSVFAQQQVQQERVAPKPKKAEAGTYQFIVAASDTNSVFTDDLLVIIESLRDPNKIIYYDASPTVKVKILPQSEIHRPGFRPLKEWILEEEKED